PEPAATEVLLDRAVLLRDLDELGVRRRVVAFGIDRHLVEVDRDSGQLAFDRVGLRRLLDDVHALVAVTLEFVLQQTRQRFRRLLDDVVLRRHDPYDPDDGCWLSTLAALKTSRSVFSSVTSRVDRTH